MMRRLSASALVLSLFCLSRLAVAQTASISGTVTDTTAAVVPQVKVTARNVATNLTRSTATDGSGSYRITSLVPGIYDVLVERTGFKTVEYSRVELTVGRVQNLSPTLVPSATAETITVHDEEVAPVDLDDAQIENIVKREQIEDLPLILRDPYQLILLPRRDSVKVVFVELRTFRYGLQAVEKVELWIASGREDQTATLVHFRPPRLETLHQLFRTGISRSLHAFGVHRSCPVLATILVVMG
jgi:hypothetical protein